MSRSSVSTELAPGLTGIDHVHVYVSDRRAAETWYAKVLGFRRVEALMAWATPTGPLTLEDPGGRVHLALFESDKPPTSTVAFGAEGEQFLAWKTHLEKLGIELRVADHELAWSLYFYDPDGNYHEITTYDTATVSQRLTPSA